MSTVEGTDARHAVRAVRGTQQPCAVLTDAELGATAETIAACQSVGGMILWNPHGHSDPWNHVEAAMALSAAGRRAEAERAYDWLVASQHADGAWWNYYVEGGVKDRRIDTNVCAYVALGCRHHHLLHGDAGFLETMWPCVERAIDYVLTYQQDGGEILWCREPGGAPGRFALLTGSSSILLSLRAAVACAEALGLERPDWELAAARLAHAIAHRPESFEPKDEYAMDWYYPVLAGALSPGAAAQRMAEGWGPFVMEGLGVRCVSNRPWVTAAETAECALALDAVGKSVDARALLATTGGMRRPDGSYYTGMVHPERLTFPGEETTTYTAAAVILAEHALRNRATMTTAASTHAAGARAAAGLWRGEGLPGALDLSEPVLSEPVGDSAQHP